MKANKMFSRLEPILKKFRHLSYSFTKSNTKPIIPKLNKEWPLTLFIRITSPKIQSILDESRLTHREHTCADEFQVIANWAIANNSPEIIDELIGLGLDLNQKIDPLKRETILTKITIYPYYHNTFVKLIESGAKPYCDTVKGEEHFHSNALNCSVRYDEFLNISYLLEKQHCSSMDALKACYEQNKLHMLQYFLEITDTNTLIDFRQHVQQTKMVRQKESLDIIDTIISA